MLLPQISSAFTQCPENQGVEDAGGSDNSLVALDECALREHILQEHKQTILESAGVEDDEDLIYDTYREALAVQERNIFRQWGLV